MVRQNKVDGVHRPDLQPPIWRLPLICLLSVSTGILEPVCPVSLLITLAADSWPPKNCWNWAVKSCSFCVWVQLLPASPTNARPALRRPAGNEASLSTLSVQNEEGFTPFDTFLDAHLHSGVFDYDGIFCNTDRLCYEIEKRLRARGVLVPTHVQMIGFDGIYRFDSEDLSCSTIVQPAEQIARAAVDLLLVRIVPTCRPWSACQ